MRKPATLIIALIMIVHTTNAAFTESKIGKKANTTTVFTSVQQRAAAEFFATLSRKEYEQLTGRHLTLLERIVLKWAQKRANKRFGEEKQSKGFNPIGFFAPLLLGIIGIPLGLLTGLGLIPAVFLSLSGVAGTYAFSKDKNMHKWAWIGLAAFVVGLIILIIMIIASGDFG